MAKLLSGDVQRSANEGRSELRQTAVTASRVRTLPMTARAPGALAGCRGRRST